MTAPPKPRPFPRDDAVKRYFDGRAGVYRDATARGLWAWERRREADAILALCGTVTGLAVLDLGCGAGFYAERLAHLGAMPVVAVDASERMLSQIATPGVITLKGDAGTVDAGRRFDRVLLAGVLEFVDDPTLVLSNGRRHLAPGGRIVLLLPPANRAGRLYQWFHASHGVAITLFDRQAIEDMADAAGLRIRTIRPVPPMALACAMEAR